MKSYIKTFKLLTLATAVASGPLLQAAEWTLAPKVELQVGHDSNLRLTKDNEDGVIEGNANVSLVAKRRTETSDVALTAGYNQIVFDNAEDNIRDRDQQFAQAILRKKWTRWATGASLGLRRDDLLRIIREGGIDAGSELGGGAGELPLPDEEPLDDLAPDDELGDDFAAPEQIRRTFYRGSIYGQYELNERDRLRLSYGYANREYTAGGGIANLRDSERHSLDLQYARDLSARTVLTANVTAAELRTDNRPDSNFYQGQLSWRARYSETTRLELGAGVSHVKSDNGSSTGFLARIMGTALLQQGKITGELKRALIPNAFGNISESDVARLRYLRPLSENVQFSFDITGQRRQRGGDDDRSERDQLRTGISTSWNFAPQWSLGTTYEFAWINRKDELLANAGKAKGHRGVLSLVWQPQIIRIGQ